MAEHTVDGMQKRRAAITNARWISVTQIDQARRRFQGLTATVKWHHDRQVSQREEDTRYSDDALILSTDYASVNHAPAAAASSVAALKERNFIPTTVEAVRQARSNSSNWA